MEARLREAIGSGVLYWKATKKDSFLMSISSLMLKVMLSNSALKRRRKDVALLVRAEADLAGTLQRVVVSDVNMRKACRLLLSSRSAMDV